MAFTSVVSMLAGPNVPSPDPQFNVVAPSTTQVQTRANIPVLEPSDTISMKRNVRLVECSIWRFLDGGVG
jgi:hypothetical protein